MHTAETMSRSFETVGDPVLVLCPDDRYVEVYQTTIPRNLKKHPTVWCREFKVQPTLKVYMFSKPGSALLSTEPHTGQENVYMTLFALYHSAPPSGDCYMQFKIDDAITDATEFVNTYRDREYARPHNRVRAYVQSHYNDDNLGNFTIKDFLIWFHGQVCDTTQQAQLF